MKYSFEKIVNEEVVVKSKTVKRDYEFPLYLKREIFCSDEIEYLCVTEDSTWSSETSKAFNFKSITLEHGKFSESYTDKVFCHTFLDSVESYNKTSNKCEFSNAVNEMVEFFNE